MNSKTYRNILASIKRSTLPADKKKSLMREAKRQFLEGTRPIKGKSS